MYVQKFTLKTKRVIYTVMIVQLPDRLCRWFFHIWELVMTELKKDEEHGRSMIEMLGVLAIVGILSVSGIAGFSKAMMKHKLIKQTEQFSQLFNEIDMHLKKFERRYGSFMSILPVFQAMGSIPEGMRVKGDELSDGFGNIIKINMNDCYNSQACEGIVLNYRMGKGNDFAICNNLMQIAIAHAPTLHRYHTSYTLEDSPNTSYANTFYGDRVCNNGTCIRDIDMNDIVRMCQTCLEKKTCKFTFVWNDVR